MASPMSIGQSNLGRTVIPETGDGQQIKKNCDADDTPPPGRLWLTFESTPPSKGEEDWNVKVKERRFDLGGIEGPASAVGEACLLVEIERTNDAPVALLIPDTLYTVDNNGYVRREAMHGGIVPIPMATNFRRITLWMNLSKPVFDCIGGAGRLTHPIDLGGWSEAKVECKKGMGDENACVKAADPQCVFYGVRLIPIPPALPRRPQ